MRPASLGNRGIGDLQRREHGRQGGFGSGGQILEGKGMIGMTAAQQVGQLPNEVKNPVRMLAKIVEEREIMSQVAGPCIR